MSLDTHMCIFKLWLKLLLQSEFNGSMEKTALSSTSSKNNTTATSIVPLLTSSMIEEENANSILDEHLSRIWERSAQQTPSRSPGRHSPPDRTRKGMGHSQPHPCPSSMPGTLHVKNSHAKKRPDFSHSMSSFDSGVGDDLNKCSVETHKHIHHHHHHHHEKGRKNKQRLELAAQQHSMVCWGDGTPRHHSASATKQRPSRSASSDATSNKDSGISMIESYGQDMVRPDPANIKYVDSFDFISNSFFCVIHYFSFQIVQVVCVDCCLCRFFRPMFSAYYGLGRSDTSKPLVKLISMKMVDC